MLLVGDTNNGAEGVFFMEAFALSEGFHWHRKSNFILCAFLRLRASFFGEKGRVVIILV